MSNKTDPKDPFSALFAEAVEAVEKNKTSNKPEVEIATEDEPNDPKSELEIDIEMETFDAPLESPSSQPQPEDSPDEGNDFEGDEVETTKAPMSAAESLELRVLDLQEELTDKEAQLKKAKKIIVRRKAENTKLKAQMEHGQKELIQHRMLLQSTQNRLEMVNRRLNDAEESRDQNSSRVLQLQTVLDQATERLNKEQHLRNKETEELRVFEGLKVIRNLLPALDNLQLALKHQENSLETFASGIGMIEKQFLSILGNMGLSVVDAEQGVVFDPNVHEAVISVASTEQPPNTILEQVRAGYTLHERLVRAARVTVSVLPEKDSEDTPSLSGEESPSDPEQTEIDAAAENLVSTEEPPVVE